MQENEVKTLPVHQVIRSDYPSLRWLAQVEQEGYFTTPRGRVMAADVPRLAVTFDELLRRSTFAFLLSRMLRTLEEHYKVPVDLEFTVKVLDPDQPKPQVQLSLLQCRPQSVIQAGGIVSMPRNLDPEAVVFTTSFMVPQGAVNNIRRVLFVTPEGYFQLPTQALRSELRRVIAHLNRALDNKSFLCVGPGRWGTVNPDLGVFVSYTDINHSAALVELSGKGVGVAPDPPWAPIFSRT